VEWADLFQQCILGLLRAIHRFDPDRGTRFSTYAVPWIRQSCNAWKRFIELVDKSTGKMIVSLNSIKSSEDESDEMEIESETHKMYDRASYEHNRSSYSDNPEYVEALNSICSRLDLPRFLFLRDYFGTQFGVSYPEHILRQIYQIPNGVNLRNHLQSILRRGKIMGKRTRWS
jgi:RNA polymerase sigma factor (sigma-70 family)